MANESRSGTGEPDIDLETITNLPGIEVPECCRENYDDCPHRLPQEKKTDYNPV